MNISCQEYQYTNMFTINIGTVFAMLKRLMNILKILFCSKNGKLQKRGRLSMIGKLQLATERSRDEDNEGIIQLRILRVQVRKVKGSKFTGVIKQSIDLYRNACMCMISVNFLFMLLMLRFHTKKIRKRLCLNC